MHASALVETAGGRRAAEGSWVQPLREESPCFSVDCGSPERRVPFKNLVEICAVTSAHQDHRDRLGEKRRVTVPGQDVLSIYYIVIRKN